VSKEQVRLAPTTVWIVPASALGVSTLGLFAFSSWLEHRASRGSGGLTAWLARFDAESVLGAVSNTAEVVAAVLAIAITVVAIVVELNATRYSHHVTRVFLREPVNAIVMGFFVLTTLYCVWTSVTLDTGTGPPAAARAMFAMILVTASLLALIPYFAFVFAFLQPLHVVDRIRAHTFRLLRRAVPGDRGSARASVVAGAVQLEDVALNSLEHNDRTIAMASVNALLRLLLDYQGLRGDFAGEWFRIDGELAEDPDFVAMDTSVREDIERRRLWLEMKIFRQFHGIYLQSLHNHMRGVAYLVALNTRRVAEEALRADRDDLLDLTLRSFNTYLRFVINEEDVRTAYYTLLHFRLVAEEALAGSRETIAPQIAEHLRYYGQEFYARGMPFLLTVVAYDVGVLCEAAFRGGHASADPLLRVMLRIDKESESSSQEQSLLGVRRAQVQLATFFLATGDSERARMIWQDMKAEDPNRLAAIRDELLREESPDYREITDRGVNFSYLPPERRRWVPDFFAWFGPSLPALRPELAHHAAALRGESESR